MKRHTVPWLLAAFLLTAAPATADEVSDHDRFELWSGCLPMGLIVEGLHEDAADIGLTKEAITVAVRSRLRAARLYEADTLYSFLYVNVNVMGRAHNIELAYDRRLMDLISGEEGFATTWNIGSLGTHGKDSGYILSGVSQHTDIFIDEYLRVNADACE